MTDEADVPSWGKIMEDQQIAHLHFDLATSSPQSYTVEEVREISAELRKSSDDIEARMRADFQAMSPEEQRNMLDMLCAEGNETREWWESILL